LVLTRTDLGDGFHQAIELLVDCRTVSLEAPRRDSNLRSRTLLTAQSHRTAGGAFDSHARWTA
jgi:hypothetical protein